MLVTTCPRCGKPTPARLASPREILCVACGYDGPPNEAEAKSIEAASAFVLSQNASARQLDEKRVAALSNNSPALYAVLFATASVPSLMIVAERLRDLFFGLDARGTGLAKILGSLFLLAVSCGVGITGFLRLKRSQNRLRFAFAATPPLRAGDPASCRVCGAPLAVGGAVVRCTFCSTDNYADIEVISKLARRATHDADEHERALAATVAFARTVTTEEQSRALYYTLFVPLVGLWLLAVLTEVLKHMELRLDDRPLYASTMTRKGECIGRPTNKGGHSIITVVNNDDDTVLDYESAAPPKRFNASSLIGEHVLLPGYGDPHGGVSRVYGSPLGNGALVTSEQYLPTRFDIYELCFDRGGVANIRDKTSVFAVDDPDFYFTDIGGIFRAPLIEPSAGILTVTTDSQPLAIATTPRWIFFADTAHVFRAEKSGGSVISVGELPGNIEMLTPFDDDRVLAVTGTPPSVLVSDADGTRLVPLAVGLDSLSAVVVDSGDVFVAGRDATGPMIVRVRGGHAPERWVAASCSAIAADRAALYCADAAHVRGYDRNTGAAHDWFAFPASAKSAGETDTIYALAVDATGIYFSYDHPSTRTANGLLGRIAKDGSGTHVVTDGLPRVGTRLIFTHNALVTTVTDHTDDGERLVSIGKVP